MRRLVALLCSILTILPGTVLAATLLVSPVPAGEAAMSIDYSSNQVRYEFSDDRFYVERSVVTLSWAYESFFAGLGYIADTDIKRLDIIKTQRPGERDSDPGFLLGVGARGAVWRSGEFGINAFGQIHSLNEKFVENDVRYKMQSIEILAGAVAAWEPPGWRAYAGFETVPYSDITLNAPGFAGDMDRSDFIVVHVGGGKDIGRFSLDLDVQFLGAEGVRAGLSYVF